MSPPPAFSSSSSSSLSLSSDQYERLWEINIASPPTFKTLINVIDSILTQVVFRIIKTPEFTGLKVDEMNSQQTCLLRCQYECEVSEFAPFTANEHSFCIPSNIMSAVLRTVNDGFVLKLIGYARNAPHVTVLTYETETSVNTTQSIITVLDSTVQTYSDVQFQAKKVVDLDLMSLKNMVKSAKDLKSPYIKFSIATPVVAKSEDHIDNFFTICVEGEAASLSRTFHSQTQRELEGGEFDCVQDEDMHDHDNTENENNTDANNGGCPVRDDIMPPNVGVAFGDLKIVFREAYGTQLLSDVVRHMDKGSVQLYMCPQMPLFLKHAIGENSHVISLFSGCILDP